MFQKPKLLSPFAGGKTDLCIKDVSFSKVKTLKSNHLHSSSLNTEKTLSQTLQSDVLGRNEYGVSKYCS